MADFSVSMHAPVLKYFAEVAACGSIRKAAERLYVASSAVNRQIILLEDELGTPLFDRLPNGVRLTPAGARLLQHAQETLHGFSLMRADLKALPGEKTGHVTVSAMDSLFLNVLLDAVRAFGSSNPAVTYALNCAPAYEVMSEVASGQSDVGVCFVNSDLPTGVHVHASVALPPGVMMAAGHPLSAHADLTLNDCKGYPLVRHGAHVMTMRRVFEASFVSSWNALDTRLSCNFAPMLKALVLDGHYISFFSKISWIPELQSGKAVWRPLRESGMENMRLAVVVPSTRQLSSATAGFADLLAQLLQDACVAIDKITPAG
ncbi:MAG: LysR family transcriptional regulator [Burkholderiaceae bacterium]